MSNGTPIDREMEIADAATVAAKELNADVIFVNHYVGFSLDRKTYIEAAKRQLKDRLYLVLVTEGGDAHTGYRCMRLLQSLYKEITVVVPGWCKSAGTLMCTGAHRLEMGPLGELGPLDVQALLEAFPSHGFVIDLPEAKSIFSRVDVIEAPLINVISRLGSEALFPLDREAGRNVVKYLNIQEKVKTDVAKATTKPRRNGRPATPVAADPRAPASGPERASGNSKTGNGAASRK